MTRSVRLSFALAAAALAALAAPARAQSAPFPASPLARPQVMQPGTAHYGWTDSETIVQLHGTGPWGVTYINAADDPRNQ